MAGEFLPPVVTRLTADIGDLVAKVEEAKALLDSLGKMKIPVNFDVSQASLAKVKAAAKALGGVQLPVTFDVSQMSLVKAKLAARALGGVTLPVRFDVSKASLVAAAAAANTAGAAIGAAGTRAYRPWFLTGTALHWILTGSMELLAVAVPALIAGGAWAAVWAQGAGSAYEHMQALYTSTESTYNMLHRTSGQVLGLGDALQTAQNKANPYVFQAVGAGINLIKESSGGLANTGLRIGQIFDTFAAKLVVDFSKAGGAGQQLNGLLTDMIPDLVKFGQIFGNIGHAIGNFASQMPGLAEFLLGTLDDITKLAVGFTDLTSKIHLGGATILTAGMAYEEFNRWGGLLVRGLGAIGLKSTAVTGNVLSLGHAGGVLKNILGAVPKLAGRVSNGLGDMAIGSGKLEGRLSNAGFAMKKFGSAAEDVGSNLSGGAAIGIAAVAVAAGFLIDKLVTAKTAAQNFVSTLENSIHAANAFEIYGRIADSMSTLAGKIVQTSAATNTWTKAMAGNRAAGRYMAPQLGVLTGNMATYTSGLQKMGNQLSLTNNNAHLIARTYHTTLPGAMALAMSVGENLDGQLKTQGGNWTTLGQRIKDAVSGYKAMGQGAGNVGHDTQMLAIESGLAATKVASLSQAYTAFMGNVTGGQAGMAQFVTSLQNIGSVAGKTKQNLGTATGTMTLNTKQFAQSLTHWNAQGASAWTNFTQVVGQTAPQVISWLQTAGAEGAISGKKFNQGVLDMAAPLVGFASKSKGAQSDLVAMVQAQDKNIKTFPELKAALKDSGASLNGLGGIIDTTSQHMGNMSQVAQNLGNVMNAAFDSAISTAALQTVHFQQKMDALSNAIRQYGNTSPQAVAAARAVANAQNAANKITQQGTRDVGSLQSAINSLHGKTINVHTSFTTSGNPSGVVGAYVPPQVRAPGNSTMMSAAAPASVNHVHVHLDGRQIYSAVQKQAVRRQIRTGNNGLQRITR